MRTPQLYQVLQTAGIILFLFGAAAADSDMIFTPAVCFITGLILLIWSAYEDGYIRKRGKKK